MKNQTVILSWMQERISEFLAELALSKSKTTVEAYKYDVEQFMAYLSELKVKSVRLMKPTHIIGYLGKCKSEGKSDSSVNRYYMSIRCFCKHLRRAKVVESDLTQDIPPPRNVQKVPRVPSNDEILLILEQPNIETESGLRDRAILELLYSSGLRASELCALEMHHVGPNSVLVSCGKRSKTRTVPITEEAYRWINDYVTRVPKRNKWEPLFQTVMGKPLRRQLLCAIVMDYAKKAGVEKVTTHTMRHACATHLLDRGADLRLIQEVLGHSSIASTQRYTHLSSSKMQEMFQQFHPRKMENDRQVC